MNFWERDENTYKNYRPRQGGLNFDDNDVKDDSDEISQNQRAQYDNSNGGDWQDKIRQYAGKSQEELMSELITTANRMRGEGNLSNDDLESFFSRASAFLNEEQKARMRSIIDMLKR